MEGQREGMSQAREVSWPAEHLQEGLGKNVVSFIQRSELLAGLGEHGRERNIQRLQNPPCVEHTGLGGEGGPCGHECCWLGGCRAGFGKYTQRFEGGKSQSLNPKCDTVFQLLWSWRGSVPRNAVATTNTWPYTGKGESELLFSAT